MESDELYLLVSGIQHFSFCKRQWAMIHIEQQWEENYFTVDGSLMHEKADNPFLTEKRGNLIVSRAMPVRSYKYGIIGKCDIVEFNVDENGIELPNREGRWQPVPVEYKRGSTKENDADRLQLCAEAICLEEMLCCKEISYGYLYYGTERHREKVALDEGLREKTIDTLMEMKNFYQRGYTPKVKPSSKCNYCSLKNICLPKLQKYNSVREYTDKMWEA